MPLTYNSYDLSACMAANGLDCEASDAVLDLAPLIPQELALKISAAARLYLACNPTASIVNPEVVTKIATTDYTLGTTDPLELYGGVIYVTGAATIIVPLAEAGMSFTIITIGAVAVSVDPNIADFIYLNGTPLDDGDKITNTSTPGEAAVFTYYPVDGWCALADNTWIDDGV